MASGGVVSLTDPIRIPQYSSEEIHAVTEEAKRRGSYVVAHAYSPEAISHAVINGVRSIEHGNLLDERSAQLLVDHEAVLVPTLITYMAMAEHGSAMGMSQVALDKNAEVLTAGKHAIELAMRYKVVVGFGTDLMGELERFQLGGLRVQHEVQGTLELLRSLTSRNAKILSFDKVGTLAVGNFGDLLILSKDPFKDPSTLWTLDSDRVTIKGGKTVE
jgi:imidazolonepropionase-like amidohydrolase